MTIFSPKFIKTVNLQKKLYPDKILSIQFFNNKIKEEYIEVILELEASQNVYDTNNKYKIIVLKHDDLNKEVFDATYILQNYNFYNKDMSTRAVSDENFIVVSDEKGVLRRYSKSTNEVKTYTVNSNAVALTYIDSKIEDKLLIVYNDKNILKVESPLFDTKTYDFEDENVLTLNFFIFNDWVKQFHPNTLLKIKVLTIKKLYTFSLSNDYKLNLIE
jgi:hypothetical protein